MTEQGHETHIDSIYQKKNPQLFLSTTLLRKMFHENKNRLVDFLSFTPEGLQRLETRDPPDLGATQWELHDDCLLMKEAATHLGYKKIRMGYMIIII